MYSYKNARFHDEIKKWNTEQLIEVLEQNGLGDCCEAVRSKEIDGMTFLSLSETKLAFWKNKLSTVQIRRLWSYVQLAQEKPQDFIGNLPQTQTKPTSSTNTLATKQKVEKIKSPIAESLERVFGKQNNPVPLEGNNLEVQSVPSIDLYPPKPVAFPPKPANLARRPPPPPGDLKRNIPERPAQNSYPKISLYRVPSPSPQFQEDVQEDEPTPTNLVRRPPQPPGDIRRETPERPPQNNYPKPAPHRMPSPPRQYQEEVAHEDESTPTNLLRRPPQSPGDIRREIPERPPQSNYPKPPHLRRESPARQYQEEEVEYEDEPTAPTLLDKRVFNPVVTESKTLPEGNYPNVVINPPNNDFNPSRSKVLPPLPTNLSRDVRREIPERPPLSSPQLPSPFRPPTLPPTPAFHEEEVAYEDEPMFEAELPQSSRPQSSFYQTPPPPKPVLQPVQPMQIPLRKISPAFIGRPLPSPPKDEPPFPLPPNVVPVTRNGRSPIPPELPRPPVFLPVVPDFHSDEEQPEYDSVDEPDIPEYKAHPWFKDIDRREASTLLKGRANGSFIVRPSTKQEFECTFCVVHNNRIYNLAVRKENGKLVLGRNQFDTVSDIVERFLKNPLVLDGPNNEDIFVTLRY